MFGSSPTRAYESEEFVAATFGGRFFQPSRTNSHPARYASSVLDGRMTIRKELRARTAEAHQVVDLLYSAHDLSERSHYREFLSRHASVVVPLEARMETAGVAAILPDWSQRRRTPALLADLAALRGAFQPAAVPRLAIRADVVGCLYVLEGSRLGSRVLLRSVVECDGLLCCAATRYLSHGMGHGLWTSFLAFLDEQPFTRGETERAVAAAAMTFELFARSARNATPQSCWSDLPERTPLN